MWIVFGAVIASVLALDLFVLHKEPHAVSLREAMTWSAVWITLALLYGGVVALLPVRTAENPQGFGPVLAQQYLAAYVIELALSVDNLFVFAVIFAALGVKREHQHKLLFWGVIGALILRAIFIFAGVAAIKQFDWLMYFFGGILVFTGLKLLFQGEKEVDPKKSLVVRMARKLFPVKPEIGGPTFWVKVDGKWFATMLFIGLIMVEATDVVFAIDSIPAALTVALDPETKEADPLVVYASNAFAIMGLRSLYFALAGIMGAFRFLKYGLAIILTFVGVKMVSMKGMPEFGIGLLGQPYVAFHGFHVPVGISLGIICGVLVVTVALSMLIRPKVVPVPPRKVEAASDESEDNEASGPRA